jgi:hypothetical protein
VGFFVEPAAAALLALAVRVMCSGIPSAPTPIWILLLSPLRERPMA